MNIYQKGIKAKSNKLSFTAGDVLNFDLAFLRRYMRAMKAPVVQEVQIEVTRTGGDSISTDTVTGEDMYKLLDLVEMRDIGGSFFRLPGALLRIDEQYELGDKQEDPDNWTSGNGFPDPIFRCIFDPGEEGRRMRPADTRVELNRFTEGGEFEVQIGKVPDDNSGQKEVQGEMTLHFFIKDERQRELKSRLVKRDQVVQEVRDDYKVRGSLFAAILTSRNHSGQGYDDLSSISTLTSQSFDFANLDTDILRREYLSMSRARASDDEILASTPGALPLHVMPPKARIGQAPLIAGFDIDLEGASVPSNARILLHEIQNRVGSIAASWMGATDTTDLIQLMRKHGRVKAQGRANRRASLWDPELAQKLPMDMKG